MEGAVPQPIDMGAQTITSYAAANRALPCSGRRPRHRRSPGAERGLPCPGDFLLGQSARGTSRHCVAIGLRRKEQQADIPDGYDVPVGKRCCG